VRLLEITPQSSGYAGARTLAVVESRREESGKNHNSQETRCYLGSQAPGEITREKLARMIRGHWGSVEINTHWRRDVLMGEDGTRSRRARLIVNVALLRNALLALMSEELGGQNQVAYKEAVQRRPSLALRLLRSH
jgi:predicted transposase YbfD/YdcC